MYVLPCTTNVKILHLQCNLGMNAESSRSHLVIGITIETTNKVSGQILKGKVSTSIIYNKTRENHPSYMPLQPILGEIYLIM